MKANHPNSVYVWVLPVDDGALLRAVFKPGDATETHRQEFLDFVNRANSDAQLTRYLWRHGYFVAEAWFPGIYERRYFDMVFDKFTAEISRLSELDPAAVRRFFPIETAIE